MTRLFLLLWGALFAVGGHAVVHGHASSERAAILLFTDQGLAGSGVLIAPQVALTVDHVAAGEKAIRYRFTDLSDGRDPRRFPAEHVGHFKDGKTLSPRPILKAANAPPGPAESPTLLLVDERDWKKFAGISFPKLPAPNQVPRQEMKIIGYGETGWSSAGEPVRWMRSEGTVRPGFNYPRAPYLFEMLRGPNDQLTGGGDSGGPTLEGNFLMGLHLLVLSTAPDSPFLPPGDRSYAGTDFWIAERSIRAEIDVTLKAWHITLP